MIDSPGRKDAISRFPGPYRMTQKDIAFNPHILIVPVGANVAFPNMDKVRHHVYSFSSINKFELKLYGREENRSVVFPKPGVAALGCNIHDSMAAFVVVVDTPFAARTDAAGRVSIPGVPPGRATLRVWHASIRAPGQQTTQPLAIPAGPISQTISVPVR
ncbi:MAG: carboxypeptidase regulatory-like domain-containing protein [Pseudomonadota bacterium]